jgi:hypothetical protein
MWTVRINLRLRKHIWLSTGVFDGGRFALLRWRGSAAEFFLILEAAASMSNLKIVYP